MQRIRVFIHMFVLASLGACGYPISGEWEGIEQHFVVDGEVAETRAIPFEDCFSAIDSESGEAEESTTCVNRGFSLIVDSAEEILFEATNDLTQGQQVPMYTKSYTAEGFVLSDGNSFEVECILNKEQKEKFLYWLGVTIIIAGTGMAIESYVREVLL